ncbi:MAG: signal recognition particle receptor subunit alpha, partial [Alistipes sp.]|nr:signal recognition particle receptor subunit alpha [Alistipes sp.]
MGFFDLFKRKKTEPKVEEPKVVAPEVKEQVVQETPAVTETPAVEVAVEEKPQEEVAPQVVEETAHVAEPQAVVAEPEDDDEPNIEEERKELEEGLGKTKEGFFGRLKRAIAGRTTVDADVLDDLEEVLITSDVGVET